MLYNLYFVERGNKMLANLAGLVIGGVIVIVVVLVAGYYILRYMRGSLKMVLPMNGFDPGEKVAGSFELKTRKIIEARRLYAALVGEEVTKERRGDKTRSRRREIYRDEQTIEETRTFAAGETLEYSFELTAPSVDGPDFLDSALGQALKTGMSLLSGRRRYLRWKVQVRLDAKGIDLSSSKRITLNMPQAV